MDESNLGLVIQKNDDAIAYRIFEDQMIIIDLQRESLNILNETATVVWDLIGRNQTINEIVQEIVKRFEVSIIEATTDVLETIENMSSAGWIKGYSINNSTVSAEPEENKGLYHSIREIATLKKIPLVIHFDLTYRCSLDCIHCYLDVEKRHLECSLGKIKDILDQLADAGSLYLTLSGGEIFLRDDLFEIVSYARKLHFSVRLLTNGTSISAEKAEEISRWHPEMVAISVYDMDPSIHDAITRKKGSFKETMGAIYALKKRGISLKISSVLMNCNFAGYRKVYDFAKELGAQFQADYRITPKLNGSQEPLKLQISGREIMQVLSDPIFSKNDYPEPDEEYSGIFNSIPCGAGHMSCYISPSGEVMPCVQVQTDCGNLNKKAFSEIWSHSSVLNDFRTIRFADIVKCSQCERFKYCRPCPGLNLVETGSIFIPSRRTCKEADFLRTLNKRRR